MTFSASGKRKAVTFSYDDGVTILNFAFKWRSASTACEDLIYANLSAEEFILLAGQRLTKLPLFITK